MVTPAVQRPRPVGALSAASAEGPWTLSLAHWRASWIVSFFSSVALYALGWSGTAVWDDHQLMDPRTYGSVSLWSAVSSPFMGRYFRPMTAASYWLDARIWGFAPAGWHFTNTLIHALTAVAVIWLTYAVSRQRFTAALAGLLFAVQPAQVGAVAWIGGRTDCLAALFGCAFLAATVSYFRTERQWLAPAAVACYFLGALAKEQTALLIFAIPLAERAFGASNRPLRAAGAWATSVCLMTLYGLLAARMYLGFGGSVPTGGGIQLRTGCLTLIHYLQLLVVPTPSGMTSLSLGNLTDGAWVVAGGVCWIVVVAGCIVAWWKEKRLGFVFASGLLLYLPVSNFLALPSMLVGPYRVASVGVLAAVAAAMGVQYVAGRGRLAGSVVGSVLVLSSIFATTLGMGQWKSEESWFAGLEQYDRRNYLAVIHHATSQLMDRQTAAALGTVSGYTDWLLDGRGWQSEVVAGRPISLSATAQVRLGTNEGSPDQVWPMVSRLLALRGKCELLLGDREAAIGNLKCSVRLWPHSAIAMGDLGEALAPSDLTSSAEWSQAAVMLDPNWPNLMRLGKIRMRQHQYLKAEHCFRAAAAETPQDGNVLLALAVAELRSGSGPAAKAAAEALVKRARVLPNTDPALIANVERQFERP